MNSINLLRYTLKYNQSYFLKFIKYLVRSLQFLL